MKRMLITGAAALTLLLGGCATVVTSDVTTFNQLPSQLDDKSYSFVAPAPQEDTLEMRAYQNLVRGQLARLGFREASAAPALKVAMHFMTIDVPIQVIEPSMAEFYPYGRVGLYGRRFGGFYGSPFWGSPFYGPYWGGPMLEVSEQHRYQRQLRVAITSSAGQPLYEVTVRNTSRTMSTPALMPALVQSAFEGFPGPNGAARRIQMKQNG